MPASCRSAPAVSWGSAPTPATSWPPCSPRRNILVLLLASGLFSAALGVLFGLPSLRIKGFYLVVATLAAQFFLDWCFNRIAWLYNYNASGAIEVPTRAVLGVVLTGPTAAPLARYYALLLIVGLMAWVASNLVRGRVGRAWMMVRDMDIAAELMGVRLLRTKLLAFAVSSFYCGVAGALMVFLWLGAAEASSFGINVSFQVLFMVIIGGTGSLVGSFMGAAFIWILPIVIRAVPAGAGDLRRRRAGGATEFHDRRRSDHRDPDPRAAWDGAAVAGGQTADADLAIPLLTAARRHPWLGDDLQRAGSCREQFAGKL